MESTKRTKHTTNTLFHQVFGIVALKNLIGDFIGEVQVWKVEEISPVFTKISIWGGECDLLKLEDFLRFNKNLTSINLRSNQLESDGANHIANALKENSTLRSINLYFNELGSVGASHIADALKENSTLTSINLDSNEIYLAAAGNILNALKFNSTLNSISLMGLEDRDLAKTWFEEIKHIDIKI